MTYSNKRAQSGHQSRHQGLSLFTPNTLQSNEAYFAALAPVFRAMVVLGLSLLSRVCAAFEDSLRYNCDHNTKKFKVAMLAMILFMMTLKGSREEKTEFLGRLVERLYAKRNARLKELQAKYLVWRQRKCWAWGGGFIGGSICKSVNSLPDMVLTAGDQKSFDALIPD